MVYSMNLPDSTNPCILLVDDEIYISKTLRNPSADVNDVVKHGRWHSTNLIAAKIPEKPAPMTLTFIGRLASTGSLFNANASPLTWPLVGAIFTMLSKDVLETGVGVGVCVSGNVPLFCSEIEQNIRTEQVLN